MYRQCTSDTYIFYNHDKERQLNAKRFLGICWTCDIISRDIAAGNFEHRTVNILIGDTFDVPIAHFLIPNLQRLTPGQADN